MRTVLVTGDFDNPGSAHVRLLHEAARRGRVHVVLWSDVAVERATGQAPRFPAAERRYYLEALRYVSSVSLTDEPGALPDAEGERMLAVPESAAGPLVNVAARTGGLPVEVIRDHELEGFPELPPPPSTGRPKVLVTGCYDWLHSGHVRFFEEAAEHGELYVVVGHDANVRLLKGEGHPLYGEQERRYMVGSIRHVHAALVSTGEGWMDAAPEIERIRPDIYLVNEDGDKPEKRAFCEEHGLRYVVLPRARKEGLPRRESTSLRGY
ncbi:MAG: adenylyltransferase/cytidyltransferase family protein [Armatimonadetes bacterium]|nr:adenylyltransferase/cytidyltransferase family protein [Armatimonadota bacterium]